MSDNFRQAVEEIAINCPKDLPPFCPALSIGYQELSFREKRERIAMCGECVKCRTDRILAAHNAELDRIAEGLPRWDYTTAENFGTFHAEDNALIRGRNKQYSECQAYIQAQKGS